MPNWCNNNFAITGDIDSIKPVWEEMQKTKEFLNVIVPQPDNIFKGNLGATEREECAEQGIPNWYDWNIENWGTKWDVDIEGFEFWDNGDGTATISGWFDSAWSPPINAYETLAGDMDSCVIECSYYEPGMDFAGFWSSENGDEFCESLHDEYEAGDDASELYKRLDEEFALSEQFEMWDDDTIELEEE